jgi:hypothetical protein
MRRSGKQTLLEERAVLRLLQTEIAKAGGQSTWAKRNGVNRSNVNSFLHGRRPIQSMVLVALGLKKASAYTWVQERESRNAAVDGRGQR